MIKKFDCIICPMSCKIDVTMDEQGKVQNIIGNRCPRGDGYVRQELLCPMRMLTTTVVITHAIHPLLPVITSTSVPKAKLFDIMKVCKSLCVEAPILAGSIVVENIANSGADLIASRDM